MLFICTVTSYQGGMQGSKVTLDAHYFCIYSPALFNPSLITNLSAEIEKRCSFSKGNSLFHISDLSERALCQVSLGVIKASLNCVVQSVT